jgi:hypothetical protein
VEGRRVAAARRRKREEEAERARRSAPCCRNAVPNVAGCGVPALLPSTGR